ncbi:uncharacterized protein ColSpa_10081 [Colletotrichum spaethianum]|uniref:Uncharacterized protein n=1 Tax=Colletotrichum spaethianum TaxID=700344 RepID=A0AA37PD26_9PEZI|nr:uncharacterized protein ColSpa_10081 [Colletotrichum spaethianum]GKT49900.1 hypothetical protein ColSpa_10081 [Colletotrichum spaethianum]
MVVAQWSGEIEAIVGFIKALFFRGLMLAAFISPTTFLGSSSLVLGLLKLSISGVLLALINFMSGLSCGNVFLHPSSRTLYNLAQNVYNVSEVWIAAAAT